VGSDRPSRAKQLTDAVADALPRSVVRWAASKSAPVARLSGHTSVGSAALSRGLQVLARPRRPLRSRSGPFSVDDVADRLDRSVEELRSWQRQGLLGPDVDSDRWGRETVDRATLVDMALAAGANPSRLAQAGRDGNLLWVTLDSVLAPRGTMAGDKAARAAGVEPELLEVVWRGLGLPPAQLGSEIFSRRDVQVLRTLDALSTVFTDDDIAETATVVGRAMSELATMLTEVVRRRMADPLLEAGASEADVVVTLAAVRDLLLPTAAPLVEVALQRHIEAAIRAEVGARMEQLLGTESGHRVLSVAFADLVDFTADAERRAPAEVRHVATTLLKIAESAVTDGNGRIVKGIGDAVMFTTADPVACGQVALRIVDAVERDDTLPPVRVGCSHGPVYPAYADYFGRTVNVASRLCSAAEAGEVLVHLGDAEPDTSVWRDAGLTLAARAVGPLKGIDGTVEAFRVTAG